MNVMTLEFLCILLHMHYHTLLLNLFNELISVRVFPIFSKWMKNTF